MCTFITVVSAEEPSRDISAEEAYAQSLKQLGLFRGVSDTDFDLDRAPTRVEALVMLIRVLGEEQNALDGTWRHPFTDVPEWANAYVGYAYVNSLTNGVSATEFGSEDATAATYLTFMLRALEYSDRNNADFSWDNPYDLAKTAGILTDKVNTEVFWRADVATISHAALDAYIKNSDKTLSDKLIKAGVFSENQFLWFYSTNPDQQSNQDGQRLDASQIAELCSPAVFYIEVYSYNGRLSSTGSGFFISADGYAITNFHVAAYSNYFVITMPDGRKFDNITVIDGYFEQDLALLKVNEDIEFPYLSIGNSDEIKQGQSVYAIGSPLGLENTLSQGIISNCRRVFNETEYIQISVPIDHGSSGGALINELGQVIGVTAAVFDESIADLNLAIPINYIYSLDRSSTDGYILWNDEYYPGFSMALDFGVYTGVTMLDYESYPLGFFIKYDAEDYYDIMTMDSSAILKKAEDCFFDSLMYYYTALEEEGFEKTDLEGAAKHFKSESEEVYIKPDYNGTKTIEIIVHLMPVYYEKAPGVPDAGWYFGLTNGTVEESDDGIIYDYKWNIAYNNDMDSFIVQLANYMVILADERFVLVEEGETENGYYYILFEGKGYSVTYMYNETHLRISITPQDN